MRLNTSWTRRRLSALASFALVLSLLVPSFRAKYAEAVAVASFEINGKIVKETAADDWASGTASSTGVIPWAAGATRNSDGTCFVQSVSASGVATLICDTVKNDSNTFPGGAKEDTPGGWTPVGSSQVTPKTDLTNVYALGRLDGGTPYVGVAAERLPKAGDVHWDYELNKQTTGTGANRIPDRQPGDILVALDLGGSRNSNTAAVRVRVFKAKAGGVYDYAHPDVDVAGDTTASGSGVTARINDAAIASGPWKSYDESYNLVSTLPAFSFAEAMIDLSAALGTSNVCFNYLTAKSRASESVTSQLKDKTDTLAFPFCGGKSGTKFHDKNADGVWDANGPDNVTGNADDEVGLGGITIHLFDVATNGTNYHQHTTTSTDSATLGYYSFADVPPGNYAVCEELSAGWFESYPKSGSVSSSGDTANTTACSGHGVQTAGNTMASVGWNYSPTTTATKTGNDFGNYQKVTLSGVKFFDRNADGARDANGVDNIAGNADDEVGLDGWTIKVFKDANGNGVFDAGDTLVTQTNTATVDNVVGFYSFTLDPGQYVVCEVLQANWTQTFPTSGSQCSGDSTLGSRGYAVTLNSGGSATGKDFGNAQQYRVLVLTCNEVTGNLVISRVSFDADGNPTTATVDTDTIGASGLAASSLCNLGGAQYDNLLPSTYSLSVKLPKNY